VLLMPIKLIRHNVCTNI